MNLGQGVEPFKISLRFRFRFKKFNFQRFSSGSGSRLFKNLGSGSVQVHRFEILKVRVQFRFNDLKFKRFRLGLGSPKKADFTGSRFGFGSTW